MNEPKDTPVVSLLRGRLLVAVLAILPLLSLVLPGLSVTDTVVNLQTAATAVQAAQEIAQCTRGMSTDELIATVGNIASSSDTHPLSVTEEKVVSSAGQLVTAVSSLGATGLALFSYLRRRV